MTVNIEKLQKTHFNVYLHFIAFYYVAPWISLVFYQNFDKITQKHCESNLIINVFFFVLETSKI